MRLLFLGTSAAVPTPERGLACTCVERSGEILMFDAGEGAQVAFARAGLGWNRPMRVFVTHMHGDHCVGVLGLIQTMSLHHRAEALEVYGPEGIIEFVTASLRSLDVIPPFPLALTAVSPGTVVAARGYDVLACAALHRVEAYSYLLAEHERPGRLDTAGVEALGVPRGPLWGRLQSGEDVKVGGRTVRARDVTGPPRRGLRVGVSGDTRPTPGLEEFFAGCDWLVFESTFSHELRQKALDTMHTTAREAGELAARAGAKNLVLTHFSARHGDAAGLLAEAREAHASVTAAHDGLEIEA